MECVYGSEDQVSPSPLFRTHLAVGTGLHRLEDQAKISFPLFSPHFFPRFLFSPPHSSISQIYPVQCSEAQFHLVLFRQEPCIAVQKSVCSAGQYLVCSAGQYWVCSVGQYLVCSAGQYLVCSAGQYWVCSSLPFISSVSCFASFSIRSLWVLLEEGEEREEKEK